jgi:hypothetical protein
LLYNLEWLKEGETFPPKSEWERLKTYKDNEALFEGDTFEVLAPYCRRLQSIVNRFSTYCGWSAESLDRFELDLNYWQLMTLKTGDLIAGEPPGITAKEASLEEVIEQTELNEKLLSLVYDVSRFGDGTVRLKINKNSEKDFIVFSPSMWFPIVSQEDARDVQCHVIAWAECVNPNAKEGEIPKYVVKAQVHEKGRYTPYTFAVKDAKVNKQANTFIGINGLNITLDSYVLGQCIESGKPVKTGFNDFAIIPFHNTRTSKSLFGINDYDKITPIIAELQVRYSLESLILDKHSAPTISAPFKSLNQTESGEWMLPTGGVIATEPGDQPPAYMIWDASLQANHTEIERLEKHLYSLSEMGAIANDDAFGASQGFEALETRMTNARLKARRMSSALTRPLKKLVSALSGIDAKNISICWNDGLPNNEYRETDIATKKLQSGLFDEETLLIDHFDKTPEEAEKIVEKVRSRRSNSMTAFDEDDELDELEETEPQNDDKQKRKIGFGGGNGS